MSQDAKPPPYFDALFSRIVADETDDACVAFGRHVHWGYWDDPSLATGHAQDFADAANRLTDLVLDAAEVRDGYAVADVGCGFGGTIQAINQRHAGGCFCGINIDPRQVDRAARLSTPANGNIIRFIVGDASELPLPDASQDVVLAVECVFHFDRPRFFAECHRVLRPGGRLVLTDFTPAGWAKPLLSVLSWWHRHATTATFGHIDVSYTRRDYERLAAKTSLSVLLVRDLTRNTLPTYPFVRRVMRSWPERSQAADFDRATSVLEDGSRRGLLRYTLLAFQKAFQPSQGRTSGERGEA